MASIFAPFFPGPPNSTEPCANGSSGSSRSGSIGRSSNGSSSGVACWFVTFSFSMCGLPKLIAATGDLGKSNSAKDSLFASNQVFHALRKISGDIPEMSLVAGSIEPAPTTSSPSAETDRWPAPTIEAERRFCKAGCPPIANSSTSERIAAAS